MQLLVFALAVGIAGASVRGAYAPTQRSYVPVTDGTITVVLPHDDTVFVGGAFNYAGPFTGGFNALDSNNQLARYSFPALDGSVFAVVSDGQTGWYVGGDLSTIGGAKITQLVHLDNTLAVQPGFPSVSGVVYFLAREGDLLFVAGRFDNIEGKPRRNLAAINTTTGHVTEWDLSVGGDISAMTAGNGSLFVAQGGGRILVFDIAKKTSRDLPYNFETAVRAMVVMKQTLYVGGEFRKIDFVAHGTAAAIDLKSGQLLSWDPLAGYFSPFVYSLAVAEDAVFIGGNVFLVAYDPTNDKAKLWDVAVTTVPGTVNPVSALALVGEKLLVGGEFSAISSLPRFRLAVLDAKSGEVLSDTAHANGQVNAIGVNSNVVAIGGYLRSVGGHLRTNLFSFQRTSGEINPWNPALDGAVHALAIAGNRLFLAGQFTTANAQPRQTLALIDARSGQLDDWNPRLVANPRLFSNHRAALTFAMDSKHLFVGGGFTNISGISRNYLAAFELSTLEIMREWNPNPNSTVTGLVTDGNRLYVAGRFTTVSSQLRSNLAAVSADLGELVSWNPDPSGFASAESLITSLSILDQRVYLAGFFSKIQGENRKGLAAVSLDRGELLPWDPLLSQANSVSRQRLAASAGVVFVSAGDNLSSQLFKIDANSARQLDWTVDIGPPINAIVPAREGLYVGTRSGWPGSGTAGNRGLILLKTDITLGLPVLSAGDPASFRVFVEAAPDESFILQRSSNLIEWLDVSPNLIRGGDFFLHNLDGRSTEFVRLRKP